MSFIQYEVSDRIGYIIINRPEKRNALNYQVVKELKETFDKAEKNPEVKIIILTGSGSTFCAGADLEYLQQLQNNNYDENLKDSTHLMELYYQIYNLKKVVVAQVNGHAIAGGCGLVSVCDFVFSVPDANFGYTEVRIGFIPAIVMSFLNRKIGEGRSRELLLSGNVINSSDAKNYGLVNFIVDEDGKLESTVKDFATSLIQNNSSQSMELTKQMLASISTLPLKEALQFAAQKNAEARSTEDCKKGIAAFLNKEKINW